MTLLPAETPSTEPAGAASRSAASHPVTALPSPRSPPRPVTPWLARRHRAGVIADLVPLADLGALLLAAALAGWLQPGPLGSAPAAVAAVLAPLMLYDPQLGVQASRAQWGALARAHALRYAVYAAVVVMLTLLALQAGRPVEAAAGSAGPTAEAVAHLSAGPPAWPYAAPLAWLGAWLATGLLLTAAIRALAARLVHRLRRLGHLTERVAVVGSGPVARRLVAALAAAPPRSIALLGVFDDAPAAASAGGLRCSGPVDALAGLAQTGGLDWIVLAPEPSDDLLEHQRQNRLQRRLLGLGVPLGLCPPQIGLSALDLPPASVGDRLALGLLAERPIRRWDALLKALEDRLLGTLLLLLLAPLLALIALAIRLDSPGPVLFRQRRHALDNREFDIYKFRTMRVAPAAAAATDTASGSDAPATPAGLLQTVRGDPRITRLGRFLRASSLDELPQLFNVLEGSMSLVGPRPHATDMRTEARLGNEITPQYSHRHRVKPGITGWAQVNGARGATDTTAQLRRRVALDLHYIEHWSLLLDLRILARTGGAVLRQTNAF